MDDLDAVQLGDVGILRLAQRADQFVLLGDQCGEVDRLDAGGHPGEALLTRQCGTFRCCQQSLGRHATDVDARTTEHRALNERDRCSERAGLDTSGEGRRTGTQDEEVVVHGLMRHLPVQWNVKEKVSKP